MVALFASLKWRLLTSRLRDDSTGKRVAVILGLVAASLVAALIAVSLAFLRSNADYAVVTAAVLFASQTIAWVLSPLIAFGVDETVDPHRFALLPLHRGTMLRGLTVTAVIGWLPAVNIIVLLGVAVMISPTWALVPVGLLCVAVQLLLVVVLSRAASTSMADLMSTRRGRDLGMLVGFGVFVLYVAISAGLGQISNASGFSSGFSATGTVLGWTPPGALARIPTLIHDGRLGQAALVALLPIGAIVLGYLWWAAALKKSMESGTSTTESSAPAGDHDFGGAAVGISRVVAARDTLLVWRDPMRRIPWLMVLVFMIGLPFIWIPGHGTLFAVAFGALMSGTQAGNQLGVDGSGLWLHLVAIGDRTRARAEMFGHTLLVLFPGAAMIIVAVFVCALVRGDLEWVPAAIGACLSCMFGAAGIAAYMSAIKPYAMPQSRGSMFASSVPQHKGRAFQVSMSVLLGGLALALPGGVFIPLTLAVATWWGWVGLFVGPAISGWLGWLLLQRGSKVYFESGPEIFTAVKLGDRS